MHPTNLRGEAVTMRAIDPTVWATAIRGRNLRASTLADELGNEATMLVFLRHLG